MANTPDTDLLQLSKTVAETVKQVHDFLRKRGSRLSFDRSSVALPDQDEIEFHKARTTLFGAASTLMDLTVTPVEFFLLLISETGFFSALRIASKYKIIQAVPVNGSATYSQIAERVGLDVTTVERTIRVLTARHIFRPVASSLGNDDREIEIEHTKLSLSMATDERFNAALQLFVDDPAASIVHISDAIDRWGCSSENVECGLNIVAGDSLPYWERLNADPSKRSHRIQTSGLFFSAEKTEVPGVDWEKMGNALVVDVGGATGQLSIEIARRAPNLQFIVQDYEGNCKQGEARLPAEVRGRITFQPYDLFKPQQKIMDKNVIYILRGVLHNWSDKYACRILQAIIPTMKPGDRIVINEIISLEPGQNDTLREHSLCGLDMMMWGLFNGRERTIKDFRKLARMAHPQLTVVDHFESKVNWSYAIVMALGEERV